jgi:hypothetical protein
MEAHMNINELAKQNNFRSRKAHFLDDEKVVIETAQDVSEIVEDNRRAFNSYDERARWSDNLFGNKIASIPLTVIDQLNKDGIMRGFHVIDQTRFKHWLNNPDNRAFRTRPGRV